MTVRGGDFSHFNANVPTGLDFYIFKCTEGVDYVDPTYAGRMDTTHAVKGAYHFFRMSADAGKQVQWFIDHARIQPGDIVALDFEDVSYDPWANHSDHAVVVHANEVMRLLGNAYPNNRLLLYCNHSTWTRYVQLGMDTGDGLWIADPVRRPDYVGHWVLWQYDSTDYDKDLSVDFANLEELRAWAGMTDVTLEDLPMFRPMTVNLARGHAYATLEVGKNSSIVKDAWAAVKPLWGNLPPTTVTAVDDSGNGTKLTVQTMLSNNAYRWKLPDGTSDVTIEWDPKLTDPGTEVDGYVIGK